LKHLIQSGRKRKPINMLLHGVHGIGKSTFGASAPKPIFITGEEIEEVDADKFPKCETWGEFMDYLTFIRDEEHDYKTLVIDTLDSIETLLHKDILHEDGAKDMATACGGYGKAYSLATQKMIEMRDRFLVPIRDRREMNLVILAHSTKNKFEDPLTQTSYDVFEMKLHKNAKGHGAYNVFAEWVSIIAFANFETFIVKGKNSDKKYAIGEGERRMFVSPKPAYDAKNRFDLKDKLPLKWSAIEQGVNNFYGSGNPELKEIKAEINELLGEITDEKLKASTVQNLKSVGDDIERLKKARNFIRGAIK